MDEPKRQEKKSRDSALDSHSTCSNAANQRKRGLDRFSLRRLIYSSPLVMRRLNQAVPGSSKSKQSGIEMSQRNEYKIKGATFTCF